MNIAFYTKCLSRGGAERVTVSVCDYLSKTDDNIFIINQIKGNKEYSCPTDVERIILEKRSHNYFAIVKHLRKVLKSKKIDVLIVMGVSNCIYAIPASYNLKTKVIVSERNDPNHFYGKPIVKYLSRFLMKKADGFVFQTRNARDFYDFDVDKTAIIYNPITLPPTVKKEITNHRKEIVNVGRLVRQKNQKCLIKAFSIIQKRHKDYTLAIYGEGGLHNELEDYINKLGLQKNVNLKGNTKNVLDEIKDAALFVLSSDFEGMPNALIEAMVLGLPVISTDCPIGGPSELIENEVNGILVPVADVDALAGAMDLVINDYVNASRMGENAKKIYEKLQIESIGAQWAAFILKVYKI